MLALPVEEPGMEVEILFEEPFVMAMPSSHPLSDERSICLQDLEGEELLLPHRPCRAAGPWAQFFQKSLTFDCMDRNCLSIFFIN